MNEERDARHERAPRDADRPARARPAAEQDPAEADTGEPEPGVKHMPEPDAENIMPAEDEPGTM